jgi:phenol hydroxylase P5 protein
MPAPSSAFSGALSAVRDETPLDRTFRLPVPAGAEDAFRFLPGQFVTVSDPDDDVRPPRKRAYSISSSPKEAGPAGFVEITVRDMGEFGSRFYRFPVGKRLDVLSPRGKFTLDVGGTDDLLLLAGGSGVTPFRSFVRCLSAAGATRLTTLAYSAQVPGQLLFDADFRALAARHPWFRYVPTVTRLAPDADCGGRRGRIDLALVRSLVRDPARTLAYACGPVAFVTGALDLAREAGVAAERTRREVWG